MAIRQRRADGASGGLGSVYPLGSRLNERGRLEVGGCDALELAREFGTPAYVYAEDDMRARARAATTGGVRRSAPSAFEVLYASKAFPCTAALRIFAEEGLSWTWPRAASCTWRWPAGFDPERIYMHGNNKTEAELEQARRAAASAT